jgi:hypothetical protein
MVVSSSNFFTCNDSGGARVIVAAQYASVRRSQLGVEVVPRWALDCRLLGTPEAVRGRHGRERVLSSRRNARHARPELSEEMGGKRARESRTHVYDFSGVK